MEIKKRINCYIFVNNYLTLQSSLILSLLCAIEGDYCVLYTALVNVVVLVVALLISEHVVIPMAPITATSRDPEAGPQCAALLFPAVISKPNYGHHTCLLIYSLKRQLQTSV